ncbi:MAG TPA: DUF4126 domain-containing protein, partial [Actinomycetota bacterium]|nr:DUF4126 domain-containing protein [Actinomycetota bacterium]
SPAVAGGHQRPAGTGTAARTSSIACSAVSPREAASARTSTRWASTGAATDIPPAVSLIAGLLTAGTVHGTKSAIRPVLNAGTGGAAAPVVSTGEDIASTLIAFAAILAPFLVLIALVVFIWLVVRWRRGRTAARAGGT